MSVLTGVTGAVRAAIGGYANQAVRASTEGIKNISGLPTEGNNANVDDLAELNKKKSTTILTYPIDVATDAQQGHYILFMINERIPGKIAKNKNNKGIAAATKKVYQERNPNLPEPPKDGIINLPPAGESSAGGKANKSLVMEKLPTQRLSTTIALYMPPSVSVTYNVKYGDSEIGTLAAVGSAAIDAFKAGGGTKTVLTNVVSSLTGATAKEGLKNVANSTIDAIAPGAKALSNLASGTVITPRMEMMFEGVGRRNFQYSFSFLPKSAQEARLVEDIIYHFKFYMMPKYSNPTTRREMDIPGTFDIQYMYKASENSFLNKVSTCFLTNVSVEYGADRFTAYEPTRSDLRPGMSPPPQKSKITLDFTELEVLSQDHIELGY